MKSYGCHRNRRSNWIVGDGCRKNCQKDQRVKNSTSDAREHVASEIGRMSCEELLGCWAGDIG